MKNIFLIGIISVGLFLTTSSLAFAAPDNAQKANNNPQVVADYTTGRHGIVGENAIHTGTDLVMQAGNSGNFQQWFTGTVNTDPEGDHSMWKYVGNSTACDSGWNLVINANQSWGSYLLPGNYCVKTNDFASK